jgi:hypothetical protein
MDLTYAERANLLVMLTESGKSPDGDSQLLATATAWATRNLDAPGLRGVVAADIAMLSGFLARANPMDETAKIARAGLCIILESELQTQPEHLKFPRYVGSYALNLIRQRNNAGLLQSPLRLTAEEKHQAMEMFRGYQTEGSQVRDLGLVRAARQVTESIQPLIGGGLLQRFKRNVDALCNIVDKDPVTSGNYSIARAGLRYVTECDDVINDSLGLVGFLDDNFIVQQAVDLIHGERQPWVPLIEETFASWPFLYRLVWEQDGVSTPISEFLALNSSLLCPSLRRFQVGACVVIGLPQLGPMPALLAVISSLGSILNDSSRNGGGPSYQLGQRVKVDNSAIRTFAGLREHGEVRLFGLARERTKQGHTASSVEWLPMSDLYRLSPVDEKFVPRGRFVTSIGRSDGIVPPLEQVTGDIQGTGVVERVPQTVLVAPLNQSASCLETLSIFGAPVLEVVPVGHLSRRGEIDVWAGRSSSLRPALLIVPDLDSACEYFEANKEKVGSIIVQTEGANLNRAASLNRLKAQGAHLTVLQKISDLPNLPQDGDAVLQWSDHDFKALTWPEGGDAEDSYNSVSAFERRLQVSITHKLTVQTVALNEVTEAYDAIELFKVEANPDDPDLVGEYLGLMWSCFTALMRTPVALQKAPLSLQRIEEKLQILCQPSQGVGPFNRNAAVALSIVNESLVAFKRALFETNPKEELLRAVFAVDREARLVLANSTTVESGCFGLPLASGDIDAVEHHVFPGWLSRTRMRQAVEPPLLNPATLVLYGIETKWYHTAVQEWGKERVLRRDRFRAQGVLPENFVEALSSSLDQSPRILPDPNAEYEAITEQQRMRQVLRVVGQGIGVGDISALPVFFENGWAVLTPGYVCRVVAPSQTDYKGESSFTLDEKVVGDLVVGDRVLFIEGSARDVLRDAVDVDLAPEKRSLATLWRKALLQYASSCNLSVADVHARLAEAGVGVSAQAVRNWLEDDNITAPLQYRRDIPIIAAVTGDRELLQKLDKCTEAVSVVRSAHLKAGRELARRALHEAKNTGEFVSVSGARVVVATVVNVGSESILVGRAQVNRYMEGDE